jgi:hypothetical protein
MPTMLFPVFLSSGSYDDYQKWPVAMFESEAAATAWVTLKNEQQAAELTEGNRLHQLFELAYDELVGRYEGKWGTPELNEEFELINNQFAARLDPHDNYHPYEIGAPIPLNPA